MQNTLISVGLDMIVGLDNEKPNLFGIVLGRVLVSNLPTGDIELNRKSLDATDGFTIVSTLKECKTATYRVRENWNLHLAIMSLSA